jgi:O-antigen/teichoic acid export membrane protein
MNLKKSAKYLLGPVAGQIIALSVTPYLVSSYGVNAFGKYALFLAFVGLFLAVSTFRLDAYIFKIKHKDRIIPRLASAAFFLASFLSLTVYIIFYSLNIEYAALVSLTVFLQGVGSFFSNALIAGERQSLVSLSKFLLYFLASAFQVLLIWAPAFDNKMMVAYTASSFLYFMCLFFWYLKMYGRLRFFSIIELKEFARFSSYNSFSVVINSFSSQIIPISLGYLFGASLLGIYSYFNRLVVMPSVFALRMLIPIANNELASLHLKNASIDFGAMLNKYYRRGLLFGIVLTSLCFFCAFFYAYIFNDAALINSLGLIVYVLPAMISQFLVLAVSQLLGILGKESTLLKLELYRLVGLALCFLAASAADVGFEYYLLMSSFVAMVFYLSIAHCLKKA